MKLNGWHWHTDKHFKSTENHNPFVQICPDKATIDQHNRTNQHIEPTLNDMKTTLASIESYCIARLKIDRGTTTST